MCPYTNELCQWPKPEISSELVVLPSTGSALSRVAMWLRVKTIDFLYIPRLSTDTSDLQWSKVLRKGA